MFKGINAHLENLDIMLSTPACKILPAILTESRYVVKTVHLKTSTNKITSYLSCNIPCENNFAFSPNIIT